MAREAPFERFDYPRDEAKNPPTEKAADNIHVLHRFRVDGIMYAPTKEEAQARLDNAAGLTLDAAVIID